MNFTHLTVILRFNTHWLSEIGIFPIAASLKLQLSDAYVTIIILKTVLTDDQIIVF